MSFMFNPNPYDDPNAVNPLAVPRDIIDEITCGTDKAAVSLVAASAKIVALKGRCTICIDGYPSAQFEEFVDLLKHYVTCSNNSFASFNTRDITKSPEKLEELLADSLPTDTKIDPVLLYGRIFSGSYAEIFDEEKLSELKEKLQSIKSGITVVYGNGSAFQGLQRNCDLCVWMDVTPKRAVLNAKEGKFINLGVSSPRPFKETLRRAYFCDFFISEELRGNLLRNNQIDYYINADHPENLTLLSAKALNGIMSPLAKTPFRCRPVYIEGVWGGQFIKKVRNLPDQLTNVAWSFDLIPLEVSIVAQIGEIQVEFPYHTFVQKEGESIMGAEVVKRFYGYFPIRFNYDDTWHSSGNMSIQVHPDEKFIKDNFNDFGRQDESYYIVTTGHEAKTYCGFKDDVKFTQFIEDIKESEKHKTEVAYDDYVNAIPSVPGRQFMLPSGTIHASGRNQVILEIGSLTVGSYTFKLYDYLRKDLDGKPRPIHSYYGEKALNADYNSTYASKYLAHDPVLVRSGDGFKEYIVGECVQLYFTLHRMEIEHCASDNTNGVFHVLVLVDGEHVCVKSKANPELCFHMNYLDMIVVPANIGEYEIINEGIQPVVVHKTFLK
jgi:mannose-6-phosphate isomerase